MPNIYIIDNLLGTLTYPAVLRSAFDSGFVLYVLFFADCERFDSNNDTSEAPLDPGHSLSLKQLGKYVEYNAGVSLVYPCNAAACRVLCVMSASNFLLKTLITRKFLSSSWFLFLYVLRSSSVTLFPTAPSSYIVLRSVQNVLKSVRLTCCFVLLPFNIDLNL